MTLGSMPVACLSPLLDHVDVNSDIRSPERPSQEARPCGPVTEVSQVAVHDSRSCGLAAVKNATQAAGHGERITQVRVPKRQLR